ncbi:MAG TPA: hypothetical protein VF266_11680 [Thermoanaerobaculia bacterium]|jgi:hypothetical protein
MNKWAVRIVGLLLLLVFALVFAQMRATLVRLQQQQQEQRAR